MKKIKSIMKKSLNLLLCFLMILMNFSPLFTMTVQAADSNTNGMYGIVYFRTKGCGTNTNYTNVANGKDGYTNGCYGADAAFLGYNSNKSKVKFKMSGVTGWVATSDVKVIDYANNFDSYYTSNYSVKNGILRHHIMSDIYRVQDGSTIELGPKPSFMEEGKNYWSYDGHYFYDANVNGGLNGYKTMINDYINGGISNSINKSKPYYNYYQYVTHRTQSNYTDTDIANYLKNTLKITSPMNSYPASGGQSLLYGEQISFVQYQNEFGANLGLVLGLAQNESANGTSNIAFYGKNLFGHSAFDSSPGASADSYLSVAQSIYAHDKSFVSEGYLDPCDGKNVSGTYNDNLCDLGRYFGGHVGDKSSGMNVKYASDPYWGEKAAQYYYTLDDAGGFQDYDKYTIAIKQNASNVGVYKDASTSSTLLYKTGPIADYPVIVLGETTGASVNGNNKWYKIQTDPTLNSSRTGIVQDRGEYDYNNNYGYVSASYFYKINSGKAVKNRYTVTFNPNGGMFTDGITTSKRLSIEQNVIPKINAPTKAGDTFTGWSPTVMGASGNVTYVAQWKNTKYNITFNANGGKFSDGATSKVVSTPSNTKPSITNPTRDGYTFKGWDKTIANATTNTTYTAIWEKIIGKYNITFDANGGKFSDSTTSKVVSTVEGEKPVIPTEPTRDGYEFTGWDTAISEVTSAKTYKATWKEVKSYNITFDANGGKFSDGATSKVVSTNEGKVPTVEKPTRDGFTFISWDRTLTAATGETTYKATWKEGTVEDTHTKKNGEFYLDYLKVTDNKLEIKGYNIIKGINNDLNTDINYELVLVNQNTGKEYSQTLSRLTNDKEMTLPIISSDGKNYKYAWFKETISFDTVPQGDYTAYLRSSTDDYFSKSYVQNILLNEQVTQYNTDSKYVTVINNYMNSNRLMEFIIRDKKLGTKDTNFGSNQYSLIEKFGFVGNDVNIVAASYSVGIDMRKSTSVNRQIIFENVETFERKAFTVNSLENPIYPVRLINADKFGAEKQRAWFNATLSVTDLPSGKYAIYVSNESNIKDYGELNDVLLFDLSKANKEINGRKYTFTVNRNLRNRVELTIK